MAKKIKKNSVQTDKAALRKPSESTDIEIAFRKAEARKNKDALPPSDTVPKVAESIKTISSQKIPPVTKTAPHTPAPSKKKIVFIPSPVIPKQPVTKKIDPPRAVPIVDKKKSSVKMGLKPVPDEKLVLNIDTSQSDNQNHSQKISRKAEKVYGRAQVHDGNYNRESDIVIGFDFGTSSSKIVIRDSGSQKAYAVPFGSLACSENSYLIPTKVFINEEGELSLSVGRNSYANLKIHLMDNPKQCIFNTNTSQSITASELSAAYMALVIRFARDWFLKHTAAIYKKTIIHWHINLGIPSKNYDDQTRSKIFQTIAMAAWRISRIDATITITEAKKNLTEAAEYIAPNGQDLGLNESLWLHPDLVNTHPEVIMEVVGYARSPSRQNGLFLFVDVGATTLDSATFRIHSKEGEDVYALLKTSVERLGTMELHNRRIQTLKNSLQSTLQQANLIDPTLPLPNSDHYEIQVGKNELSENDICFFRECSAKIGEVIRETKECRDPNAGAWENGLPVFVCGGGARLHSYQKMIEERGTSLNASTDINGFVIKEIPMPDQLGAPGLSLQEYGRLAVAYGLSFTFWEIGKIIPASRVSDIHKTVQTQNFEDRFISKDMC